MSMPLKVAIALAFAIIFGLYLRSVTTVATIGLQCQDDADAALSRVIERPELGAEARTAALEFSENSAACRKTKAVGELYRSVAANPIRSR